MVTGAAAPRRADARRNIEAITDAATECLCARPEASLADIAAAAGVGRVTLYGHFSSRAALIETVVERVLRRLDEDLAELDLTGPPLEALALLIATSSHTMSRSIDLVAAAERELDHTRLLELHEHLAARPRAILERGQADGSFRTDLPVSWMLTTLHHLTHAAAIEIAHDRIDPADAPELITTTTLAAFSNPTTR